MCGCNLASQRIAVLCNVRMVFQFVDIFILDNRLRKEKARRYGALIYLFQS
jgi:hypothetical protein